MPGRGMMDSMPEGPQDGVATANGFVSNQDATAEAFINVAPANTISAGKIYYFLLAVSSI